MSVEARESGTVDLWLSFPDSIKDFEHRQAHAELLTPDERERCGRIRSDSDRRLFVATRALVRTALSTYAPVAPLAWQFSVGHLGKPCLASPPVAPPLYFNLAHTPGLVVCAVSRSYDLLGVDAEMIKPEKDLLSLATRYFSPAELAALRMTSTEQQARLFFSYWTLKESYLKARGDGLSLSLDHFSFRLEQESIGIILDPALRDDASHWRFALIDTVNQVVAVAVKTKGAPLKLRLRDPAHANSQLLNQVRIRSMCAPAEKSGGATE